MSTIWRCLLDNEWWSGGQIDNASVMEMIELVEVLEDGFKRPWFDAILKWFWNAILLNIFLTVTTVHLHSQKFKTVDNLTLEHAFLL